MITFLVLSCHFWSFWSLILYDFYVFISYVIFWYLLSHFQIGMLFYIICLSVYHLSIIHLSRGCLLWGLSTIWVCLCSWFFFYLWDSALIFFSWSLLCEISYPELLKEELIQKYSLISQSFLFCGFLWYLLPVIPDSALSPTFTWAFPSLPLTYLCRAKPGFHYQQSLPGVLP